MGAFDPLVPFQNRKPEDTTKPAEPPQPQPSPDKLIPIGPTDI
jgi:hypothetical protein